MCVCVCVCVWTGGLCNILLALFKGPCSTEKVRRAWYLSTHEHDIIRQEWFEPPVARDDWSDIIQN